MYGLRKDELVARAESAANAQRKADADAAETRRKEEVGALQKQLSEAGKKVTELDKLRQPRRFTPEQRNKLMDFVTNNGKGKLTFVIKASASADDARAYADEIAAAFAGPPINATVRIDNALLMGPAAFNVWISARTDAAFADLAPALFGALSRAEVTVKPEILINPDMPEAEPIWLNIGPKR